MGMNVTPGSNKDRKRQASRHRKRMKKTRKKMTTLADRGDVQAAVWLEQNPAPSPKSYRTGRRSGPVRTASFYATEEWKRLRYNALKASGGKCLCCGRSANDGAVLRVDHVQSISSAPHRKADPTNLQVLCNDCNWGKGGVDSTDWRYGETYAVAPNGRNIEVDPAD